MITEQSLIDIIEKNKVLTYDIEVSATRWSIVFKTLSNNTVENKSHIIRAMIAKHSGDLELYNKIISNNNVNLEDQSIWEGVTIFEFNPTIHDARVENPEVHLANMRADVTSKLVDYMKEHYDWLLIGYNSDGYDTHILNALLLGINPFWLNQFMIPFNQHFVSSMLSKSLPLEILDKILDDTIEMDNDEISTRLSTIHKDKINLSAKSLWAGWQYNNFKISPTALKQMFIDWYVEQPFYIKQQNISYELGLVGLYPTIDEIKKDILSDNPKYNNKTISQLKDDIYGQGGQALTLDLLNAREIKTSNGTKSLKSQAIRLGFALSDLESISKHIITFDRQEPWDVITDKEMLTIGQETLDLMGIKTRKLSNGYNEIIGETLWKILINYNIIDVLTTELLAFKIKQWYEIKINAHLTLRSLVKDYANRSEFKEIRLEHQIKAKNNLDNMISKLDKFGFGNTFRNIIKVAKPNAVINLLKVLSDDMADDISLAHINQHIIADHTKSLYCENCANFIMYYHKTNETDSKKEAVNKILQSIEESTDMVDKKLNITQKRLKALSIYETMEYNKTIGAYTEHLQHKTSFPLDKDINKQLKEFHQLAHSLLLRGLELFYKRKDEKTLEKCVKISQIFRDLRDAYEYRLLNCDDLLEDKENSTINMSDMNQYVFDVENILPISDVVKTDAALAGAAITLNNRKLRRSYFGYKFDKSKEDKRIIKIKEKEGLFDDVIKMVSKHTKRGAQILTDLLSNFRGHGKTRQEWIDYLSSEPFIINLRKAGLRNDYNYKLNAGGLHDAIPNIIAMNVLLSDVTSYYPNLIRLLELWNAELGKFVREIYEQIIDQSTNLKKDIIPNLEKIYKENPTPENKKAITAASDKRAALKLIINTVFGATGFEANPLFDYQLLLSTTVSGQFLLFSLIVALDPYVDMIQGNTDGIVYKIVNDKDKETVANIIKDWERLTGLEMETDDCPKIIQRDVNNYILLKGSKPKAIGAYKLVGGFMDYKNNQITPVENQIVPEAIYKYLGDGIDIKEFITNEQNLLKFTSLTKSGNAYDGIKSFKVDFTKPKHKDFIPEKQRADRTKWYGENDKGLGANIFYPVKLADTLNGGNLRTYSSLDGYMFYKYKNNDPKLAKVSKTSPTTQIIQEDIIQYPTKDTWPESIKIDYEPYIKMAVKEVTPFVVRKMCVNVKSTIKNNLKKIEF